MLPLQVVVPRLSTNGLRWQCSGDFVARQCLQYRGVLPVCADPSLGSPDGAILRAALQEVRDTCIRCRQQSLQGRWMLQLFCRQQPWNMTLPLTHGHGLQHKVKNMQQRLA